mgnify:CR=1 FL=1|tara:strand:+ start:747 stop:2576 length:1830 start_codon:yes stop_codon:yes gene_type:complete
MCGIGGVISFKKESINKEGLKSLSASIKHRGPDGDGEWFDEKSQIGLIHRRLSIIDLSSQGAQPMTYEEGRYIITFNGEIYNYIELKEDLIKSGFVFKSETDTEVLLALYSKYKEQCVHLLNGMFSFFIWDTKEQKGFAARDRFGEKPFYYSIKDKEFIFCSEIKGLWNYGVEKEIPEESYFNYLLYNLPKATNEVKSTFYKNVFELPPATFLQINLEGNIVSSKYWQLDKSNWGKSKLGIQAASDEFRQRLKSSIELRLRSDVAVGSSLSGGLDSSTIVSLLLNDDAPKQFSTFSACFPGFKKDEEKYVDMLAAKYWGKAKFNKVFPDYESITRNFNQIVKAQDEPFGSLSISAQFEVYKLSKSNNVKVLLDGQGADEFLGGYIPFQTSYYYELKTAHSSLLSSELEGYRNLYGADYELNNKEQFLLSKNANLYSKLATLRRRIRKADSPFFNSISPDIVKHFKKKEKFRKERAGLKENLAASMQFYGLASLLKYSDRNAMSNSIEVRLPFLDHELVEFVFTLPNQFIIKDGWKKYLLRRSMESILPQEIVWRKEKVGFATPQDKILNEGEFLNMRNSAVNELKKLGIITKEEKRLSWNYIMLKQYMN